MLKASVLEEALLAFTDAMGFGLPKPMKLKGAKREAR
jgi:hypothetical protein